MKVKSKSKTFQKGTDQKELIDFILNETVVEKFPTGPDGDFDYKIGTGKKYIITIWSYPEKEEKGDHHG